MPSASVEEEPAQKTTCGESRTANVAKTLWIILPFLLGCEFIAMATDRTEIYFVRSLVVCDAQNSTGNSKSNINDKDTMFSGSAWCADRLHVIGEGSRLQARSSSQVSLLTIATVPLQVSISERYGRRLSLLLGMSLTLASCLLYTVASAHPAGSALWYMVGNNLQAFQTLSFLKDVMVTDVVQGSGADLPQVFANLRVFSQCIRGSVSVFATWIGYLELQSYKSLWVVASITIGFLLVVAFVLCPETKPKVIKTNSEETKLKVIKTNSEESLQEDLPPPGQKNSDAPREIKPHDNTCQSEEHSQAEATASRSRNLKQLIIEECDAYRTMFTTYPYLRWRALRTLLQTMAFNYYLFMSSFMMAFHSYTQSQTAPRFLLTVTILPIIGTYFGVMWVKRFGYERGLIWMQSARITIIYICYPFWPLHWGVPWLHLSLIAALSAEMPVRSAIDLELVPIELKARWQGIAGVIIGVSSAISKLVYSHLFDARATTYFGKMQPGFFSMLCDAICRLIIVYRTLPYDLEICRRMDDKLRATPVSQTAANPGAVSEKPLADKKTE